MKKQLLLLLIFLFISSVSFSQNINAEDFIGTWKVKSLKGLDVKSLKEAPKRERELLLSLKNDFLKSTFEFTEKQRFTLHIDFIQLKDMIKNAHWRYDKAKSKIIIQSWENRKRLTGPLMIITIKKVSNKIYFALSETPMVLEVEKIKS